MSKIAALHPKAYLTSKRNVRAGLVARTKIIFVLEAGKKNTANIAKEAALSYVCVAYHLKTMKKDRLVEKVSKTRPVSWTLTPFGQQKLPAQ